MPSLEYWGGALNDDDPAAIDLLGDRPVSQGTLDQEPPLGLVTETGRGFPGSPGIVGHRAGGDGYGPRFEGAKTETIESSTESAVRITLDDPHAQLSMAVRVGLHLESEVLTISVTVTNNGSTDYVLDTLAPSLRLPTWAEELLTLDGRWAFEFQQTRHRWEQGAWVGENRKGRTSHDRVPTVFAGSEGFTETTGEVWGVHLGWSGNARVVAEHLSDGRRHVQVGELLMSGEVTLGPDESITTPTVYGAYSPAGLGPVSRSFHRFVRSRSHHPGPARPRPVMLNTWEAVYFKHDLDNLLALATRAAEVGVERFVLDDGWFLGRNDDRAALGDWTVDPTKYPDGLDPLIAHVNELGMEFGLWVEPEMISPDSGLYRLHPEWALQDERYDQLLGRNQLLLDLVNPHAYTHVIDHLDQILADHAIDYIKWDMNRDLVQPTHEGRAGARAQTLAVYKMFDELRSRHPGVEFESCASGGARADFEILARAERIWTSDSNDALDRQAIQRGFSLLFPPEVMGAHIGPPVSHTTGRHHDLGFRAASAFLGHMGIEWNLMNASPEQRSELAAVVELHKQHRALIHNGDWYRFDGVDRSLSVLGVVAADRSEAVVVIARVASSPETVSGPVRLAGLDPDSRYRITNLALPGPSRDRGAARPRWLSEADVTASGRVLVQAGLQPPVMDPESAMIVHLKRV